MLDRRTFLKSAAATVGAVAGHFVLHNPTVLAGDLLVPKEPVLITTAEMPKKVTQSGEAYITNMDISTESIPVYSWRDPDGKNRVQGIVNAELTLQLTNFKDAYKLRPGQKVKIYVVQE